MTPSRPAGNVISRISIFLSSLCVLHCLATPFILIMLPALSAFFSETVELILVLSVIPLSLAGFFPTWQRHKNYRLLLFYITSIVLLIFSQLFLHVDHNGINESASYMFWLKNATTFSGALLLGWVVFQNNRHTHYCTHPHHHQDKARSIHRHYHP